MKSLIGMLMSLLARAPQHEADQDATQSESLPPTPAQIETVASQLALLRPRQLDRVSQLVSALIEGCVVSINPASTLFNKEWVDEFGDYLRQHHNASSIPFTKDKFEYATVSTYKTLGTVADKLGNGNPGADVIVEGIPWSLKTEAAATIKADRLHVSKMMELGTGDWNNEEDIKKLREKYLAHLTKYERVFSLRCLARETKEGEPTLYNYELVEIPKWILERASVGRIEMKHNSKQNPKPAYCYVVDDKEQPLFELYFDGGTERKLQIKNLWKKNCIVHATWSFTAQS